MPSILLPLLLRLPAGLAGIRVHRLLATVFAAALVAGPAGAAAPQPLAGSGVATVPADAAFLFSSLRLREQYDAIVASNAFATIRDLPAVKRALNSWEEQTEMPGSPVSMFLTFLELPENEQAVELLTDMMARDTFVYGEPSCVAFAKLLRILQQAQQRGAIFQGAGFLELEELEMIDEEEDLEAAVGGGRIVPVARQIGGLDLDVAVGAGRAEALLDTLAANLDLLVVPDVVWGFKTSKQEAGQFQVKRLEVLARMLVEMNPDLAGSLKRKKVPGGEVVTFTLDGGLIPWDDIAADLADELESSEALDKVLDRIRGLDLVVALGIVGDWVILSLGDSVDHLDKLVLPGAKGESLVETKPFAPLRADADKKLTTIWFISQQMTEALAAKGEDLDPMIAVVTAGLAAETDLSPEGKEQTAALMERARDEYAALLRDPADWLAYSFLTKEGYEGYTWDWSENLPLDGSRPLELLDHVGGGPAAVAVTRLKLNPARTTAIAGLVADGWNLFLEHGVPTLDDDQREKVDAFNEHIGPLGRKLGQTLATKFAPAIGAGEVGLVLDARARTTRLQEDLPASKEPLPLFQPAIILPLADRQLFLDGMNDVFALGDELVEALRRIDEAAVPAGYRIPEPEKMKVDGGAVWAFGIPEARLDEQIQPAIAVGEQSVALTLVPGQAARLLPRRKLETARQLATFAEPLAAAAAVDFPALVDAIEPWIVYLTRYGCVQQREGWVDADEELTADDETEEASEALEHVDVVLEAARCLKTAAAETAVRDGATVTHWRNVIRDLPKR
jgi:hypothetical protein